MVFSKGFMNLLTTISYGTVYHTILVPDTMHSSLLGLCQMLAYSVAYCMAILGFNGYH